MARADPTRRHVGIDVSAAMPAARRPRPRARVALHLVRADVLALPVRSGAFDAATGHSFLYLLEDAVAALGEVRRAVRPGGRVAFLEPRANGARLREALHDGVRHLVAMALWRSMSRLHRRYDEATLPALLTRAGFVEARAWPVLGGQGVMAIAVRPE
jgi:ubiquinone/menaquinone biosynthesis C-methylase UbiE